MTNTNDYAVTQTLEEVIEMIISEGLELDDNLTATIAKNFDVSCYIVAITYNFAIS